MTIWRADIRPDANQEVYDVVMTPADGIVKGGDAFIVGTARVNHLKKNRTHLLFKNKDTHIGVITLLQGSKCPVIQYKKLLG